MGKGNSPKLESASFNFKNRKEINRVVVLCL